MQDTNQSAQTVVHEQGQVLANIVDAMEGKKNTQKKSSAMNHFKYFLKNFYANKNLTLENDFKDYSNLNDDLMGKYGTYLANHARQYCKENTDLLSYSSAYGYLSATKSYFTSKFRNITIPPVFQPTAWSKYLSSLTKRKAAIARESNKVNIGSVICFNFGYTQICKFFMKGFGSPEGNGNRGRKSRSEQNVLMGIRCKICKVVLNEHPHVPSMCEEH